MYVYSNIHNIISHTLFPLLSTSPYISKTYSQSFTLNPQFPYNFFFLSVQYIHSFFLSPILNLDSFTLRYHHLSSFTYSPHLFPTSLSLFLSPHLSLFSSASSIFIYSSLPFPMHLSLFFSISPLFHILLNFSSKPQVLFLCITILFLPTSCSITYSLHCPSYKSVLYTLYSLSLCPIPDFCFISHHRTHLCIKNMYQSPR